MLDVGFSEILLTSAIALIVLGPERLPKVARQVGNWMGRARVMARQLSEQLEREVSAEELLKAQTKPERGESLPSSGATFDPSYTPSIAPPANPVPPPPAAPAPAIAPAQAVAPLPAEAPPPAGAPEPVYGWDAASTTAAAMHPVDQHITSPRPDTKSSHE
jgi:Tat protein translocase TatB subunit